MKYRNNSTLLVCGAMKKAGLSNNGHGVKALILLFVLGKIYAMLEKIRKDSHEGFLPLSKAIAV